MLDVTAAFAGVWPGITGRAFATLLVVTLCTWVGWAMCSVPATEAFRIGMAAGRQCQRDECANDCGHVCDEPAAIAIAAGAENVHHLHRRPRRA